LPTEPEIILSSYQVISLTHTGTAAASLLRSTHPSSQ
jgi:hypothetical protein